MPPKRGQKLTSAAKKELMDRLHSPEATAKKETIRVQKRYHMAFANLVSAGFSEQEVHRLFGINKHGKYMVEGDKVFERELAAVRDKLENVLTNNMVTQALGYDYEEETVDYTRRADEDRGVGTAVQWKKAKRRIVKKHQPGNSTLMMFLMCNRYPESWKVSKETITKKEGYDAKPSKRARIQIESLATGISEQDTDENQREPCVSGGLARISD